MGEKYAVRGFSSKSAIAKHKAKVVLPLCLLLVLFVWNSPTLAPFDGVSSGPVHDVVADEHEAMSSQYSMVQYERLSNYNDRTETESLTNSQDEVIRAQYDDLMSQIPTQKTHEELLSADITKEEARGESTESKEEEIAIEEITVPSSGRDETVEQSPAQFELQESPPESEEVPAVSAESVVSTVPVGAEEALQSSSNITFVETKTEEASESTPESEEGPAVSTASVVSIVPVRAEEALQSSSNITFVETKTEEASESTPESEEGPAVSTASVVSIVPVRAEEALQSSSNSTFVETKTEEASDGRNNSIIVETKAENVPTGSESHKSNGSEPVVDYSVISGDRNDVVNAAIWRKWEQVRAVQLPYYTRKENLNNGDGEGCEGRQVYVYDLPSEFNADLVARCDTLFPWFSMCNFFVESGRGVPVNAVENGTQIFVPGDKWFNTHQYALELVSHARILKYKCRTDDPNKASLFYVPYYAGLDVIRWHFQPKATNDRRDELALRLGRWLEQQASWQKNGGRDHVLVLGKISWDFRRQPDGQWGSRLLELPYMKQATKVMIERNPWALNDIGVPHPTYFHPQSASDIDTWLRHVRSQSRSSLVTFVGKERKNDPTNVRTALVQQCRNSTDCRFVECVRDKCLHPAYVTKAFMATHFCMQPVGDSPTRRSVFDSLIAGCIPVLFHPCTAYVQYPWHLPANESSWSVYISEDEIRAGTVNVVEVLSKISPEQRDAMRENIINNVIPGLLYSAPGSDVSPYRDAFDITIDQLLYRVKHRPPEANSQVVPAREQV